MSIRQCDGLCEFDKAKAERDAYRTALEQLYPFTAEDLGSAITPEYEKAITAARDVLAKYAVGCPIDDQPCHPSTCTFGKRDCACRERNGIKETP